MVGKATIFRSGVQRADQLWVHGGRGCDHRVEQLRKQSICIIGAGSLGSFVAASLAQSGIGEIHNIDPEVLTWANTGRHLLGAKYVGFNKAEAVARKLAEDFPTMRKCVGHNAAWQDMILNNSRMFDDFDLVLSLTGSWRSEAQLNDWHLSSIASKPFLYGWLEPFAAAGHIVCVETTESCFQCGFTDNGLPLVQVFEWPSLQTTLRKEVGCGSFFQPYGILEMQHSVAMIAKFVVQRMLSGPNGSTHAVWVQSESPMEETRRSFSPRWLELTNGNREVDRMVALPWNRRSNCPQCSE